MKRALLLATFLLLPALAPAAAPPAPLGADPVTTLAHGESVTPRSFEFTSLPPVSPLPYTGPQTEVWDEGVWDVAAQELQRLKARPDLLPDLSALGATVTLDRAAASPREASPFGVQSVLAVTPGNGFEGITQGGYIPSEPTVAGGPLNVFCAGNVSVTVTNKDGTNRVETNGATFFGVPASEGSISDAQCYYDALRGRFVAVAFTKGTSPSNYSNFYLAISKTNDARGAWWLYKFDMTKDGATQTTNWSDYESLGITDDKLVMTAQQFTFASNAYQYPKIRVIDRAAVYAGNTVSYVDFVNFAAPSGGDLYDNFVTKCARNLTPGDAVAHLACVRVNGGSNVTYREITGAPGSPALSAGTRISVASYGVPPDAAQQGTSTLVVTNDCRPGDFYVRNGVLCIAWHFGASIGGSSVTAVRLFRMRTADRAVIGDETFGAANTFYYYPAATMDSAGTVYLGFDRSSASEYPSAYATGRRPSDAAIEPSLLLKAGTTYTSQTRWGDYTGIDNDAALSGPGGTTAWYAGQWTKGTNTFGTWVNRLSFPYAQVSGTVADDCDGSTLTTGDRNPLAGVTVQLLQGATLVATTVTDASGAFAFGYLEAGTYDIVPVPASGASNVDAAPGTGGTSQVRVSASDVQVAVTTAQSSTGNAFWVTSTHPVPVSASITPSFKVVGDPGFTMTVNGSAFTPCATVRVDGADRPTTWVSATQLTAAIPASDLTSAGARAITVFNPAPGGGTSAPQYLTVSTTPDVTPPVVSLTSPVGGEAWGVGTSQAITWSASDDIGVTAIDLRLSTDGGATFPTAIATGLANSGSYAWTVPLTPSATARVRVVAHDPSGNVAADSSHANFAITGWTITASATTGGTITPSGAVVVPDGATPSFAITPSLGYHVVDVSVNGGSVGAVTNYTFPAVHANQSIAATFAANAYTLTINVVGSGTVTKNPDQPTYGHGAQVTLTATPDPGWTFVGWTGDTTTGTNPLVLPMIANRTLTATFGVHTYVWNVAGTGFYNTAANWTPSRTSPATDDVLIFNNGAAVNVQSVPSQTLGRIVITNGTNVTMQSSGAQTLTLLGGNGTDFDVQAGCTFQVTSGNALTIALGTGATGSVAGTINLSAGAHQLVAADSAALVFQTGSSLNLGTNFSGTVFGTGSAPSGLNSVRFRTGSLLSQVAGGDPFGAIPPSTVLVFDPGSRYRLDGAAAPPLAGRTFADFECNTSTAQAATGFSAFTMDSLIVTQGTFAVNLTAAGGTIRGNVRVKPAGGLSFSPSLGSATYTFSGAVPETLAFFGSWTSTTNVTFAVANPAGVRLATNWTLGSPLRFTSGRIVTGANTLAIAAAGSVSGAGPASGWVQGNLRRNFATGSSTRTLDIGDSLTYAPVTLAVNSAAGAFDLAASTAPALHPTIASSGLDPAKSVVRTWTLTPSGSPSFATADATLGFGAADVPAGADTAAFLVRRYASGWSAPATGTRTATSTQATGLTAFGDFAVGDKLVYTITASAGPHGTITPSGVLTANPGDTLSFAIAPDTTYVIHDVLVDGASVGPVAAWAFNGIGANHTIAASFALPTEALTVNIVGAGTVGRSPDLSGGYPYGTTVTLTATPGPGWAFGGWSGDLAGTANPDSLVMNAAKTVTATFADTTPPVIAVTSPNGGETLLESVSTPLTWTASDNAAVTAVDLLLSRDGAAGAYETLAVALPNTGTWNWTVTVPATSDAWLRAIAHDAAGHTAEATSAGAFTIQGTAGVDDGPVTVFALGAIRPNPALGRAHATFAVPRTARVRLSLLDVQGREVALLAAGEFAPGRHPVVIGGPALGAGLYFVRMRVENGPTFMKRLVLMR